MEPNNLIALFNATVAARPSKPSMQYLFNGSWNTLTWSEVKDRVMKIAGGLRQRGIQKGDRVAIISKTRHEWTLADLGIMAASGVTVPIYESNTSTQAAYILENSQAKIVIVENEGQLQKILPVKNSLPHLTHIVHIDNITSSPTDRLCSLDDVMNSDLTEVQFVYDEALASLNLDHDASFVYTSGTTGEPKGAILTHGNFVAEAKGALAICPIGEDFTGLLFLPLAHILGRVTQFFHIHVGHTQCYAESIDRLIDNIATVKPHFMVSVPRIFEKIHARTLQNVENSPPLKQHIFRWALKIGEQRSQRLLTKQPLPVCMKLKYFLAHHLVFKKLHDKMGGRIRFFISGGAPLSADLALFFHAFGFTILEGYGLTETTAGLSFNRSHFIKFGTVGQPIEDAVAVKIAGDGEICVRGKIVFKGYFNNPQATREAIDEEGWFHTGDIGEFDTDGFLKITDRKKDIIVTAGGKNIAPQSIENHMITDPFISQFIVHGDKRKFLSALVVLDRDQVLRFAKEHDIPFASYEELVTHHKLQEFIKNRIEQKNSDLASYETIKKFAILPNDFSIESGELTPTLKLKRKVIYQKYTSVLDGFYKE